MKNPTTFVNVYLLLKKNNQILLYLRGKTGYKDGYYGLVSGHVEKNESAISAMIREAYEEINIEIKETDLKTVHIIHRKTERDNIDIFMQCSKWQGNIKNKEPDKCSELGFFDLEKLPNNIIPYIKEAIGNIKEKSFYTESGW